MVMLSAPGDALVSVKVARDELTALNLPVSTNLLLRTPLKLERPEVLTFNKP
jgi:hypothetical protein